MCTFLVLNISSLQLIPVTVIAYRGKYGSPDPTGIVEQPLWLRHFLRWRELSLQKIMSAADRKRGILNADKKSKKMWMSEDWML